MRYQASTFVIAATTALGALGATHAAYAQAKSPAAQKPAMSIKAPTPSAYSWTGFYAGINGGLAGGNFKYSTVEIEALDPNEPQEPTANRTNKTASGGFLGLQLGYLYQLPNNLVIGAEADIQTSNYLSSGTEKEISSETNVPESEYAKMRMPYFGTVRARLGYAVGPILPYITGGLAYGRTETRFAEGEAEAGQPPLVKSGRTNLGYSIGAGLEYAISPAWRVKAEYLYTSLSSYQATGLENATFKLPTQFNLVRVGLNYAFGHDGAMAAPFFQTPALDTNAPRFDGFSIGLTAGLAAGYPTIKGLTVEEANTTQLTRPMNAMGGLIGAEIGYHYTFADRIVLGAVADYQFTSYSVFASESEQNASEAEREKVRIGVPQFGTVRARLGYAMGAFMPYATAGFAYGRASFQDTIVSAEESMVGRANKVKTGFALGAGLEYLVTSNLSFKIEYLYVDLGTLNAQDADAGLIKTPLAMNLGRVGVSYRF